MLFLALLAVAHAQLRTEDNCFEVIGNCRGGNCGAPYHVSTTATKEECLALCRADPKCAGLEFEGPNIAGNCRMKNVMPGTQFPYVPFYRQGGFNGGGGGFGGFGGGGFGGGFGGGGFGGQFFDLPAGEQPSPANETQIKKFWEIHTTGNRTFTDGEGGEIIFPEEAPPVKGASLTMEEIRQVVENEKYENKTEALNSPMGQMGMTQPFFYIAQGRQTFRWTGLCTRGAPTPAPVAAPAPQPAVVKTEKVAVQAKEAPATVSE